MIGAQINHSFVNQMFDKITLYVRGDNLGVFSGWIIEQRDEFGGLLVSNSVSQVYNKQLNNLVVLNGSLLVV